MESHRPASATKGSKLKRRFTYASRTLPSYLWQRCARRAPSGQVQLIIAVADHFEPSSLAGDYAGYASRDIQEQRVENWCREYPRAFAEFRDHDGHPFTHTYFYPAE